MSADGLTFDVVLGFRAGESYEAECHLALYDRVVWNRLREHLRGTWRPCSLVQLMLMGTPSNDLGPKR